MKYIAVKTRKEIFCFLRTDKYLINPQVESISKERKKLICTDRNNRREREKYIQILFVLVYEFTESCTTSIAI